MTAVNQNFLELQGSYLFSEVTKRRASYMEKHPHVDIISLGIGDVTRSLPPAVIDAMHQAVGEMTHLATFKGYGPEQGYQFLTQQIINGDYRPRGVELRINEVFVSDGSKCDIGNIQEIFCTSSIVAVQDPVYPVYVDTNVMAGRAGSYNYKIGRYEKIVYLECSASSIKI